MDANLKSKLGGFVILVAFAVGCSTANRTSSKNEVNTNAPPPEENSQQVEGSIMNERGWQVPSPKGKRKIRTTEDILTSEDGKNVKTTATYFAPTSKYGYTEEATSANQTVVSGDLELGDFIEVKAGEKIFWYTIFARKIKPDMQKNTKAFHNHEFVYRILDKDGDGKFETLLADDSKVLVPRWAAQ